MIEESTRIDDALSNVEQHYRRFIDSITEAEQYESAIKRQLRIMFAEVLAGILVSIVIGMFIVSLWTNNNLIPMYIVSTFLGVVIILLWVFYRKENETLKNECERLKNSIDVPPNRLSVLRVAVHNYKMEVERNKEHNFHNSKWSYTHFLLEDAKIVSEKRLSRIDFSLAENTSFFKFIIKSLF